MQYLALQELMDSAKDARRIVARTWGFTIASVADIVTDHRKSARGALDDLIKQFVGALRVGRRKPDGSLIEINWTRRTVLEAIAADIQDRCENRDN